jgi:hypothetical protein
MPSNAWQIGALYPPGGLNGVAWFQPAGVGGQVFPGPVTSVNYYETTPFSERSGVFAPACGHSVNMPLIQREWDYNTNSSVALCCCPECGFVCYTLEPFEAALNTVFQPQLPL